MFIKIKRRPQEVSEVRRWMDLLMINWPVNFAIYNAKRANSVNINALLAQFKRKLLLPQESVEI